MADPIKDRKVYDALRREGASEEKPARIANAGAQKGRSAVGRSGGDVENYEDPTVEELRDRAKKLGLSGYSKLKKDELIDLLRNH
ncbi:Rho termination factor, N-terminal domain [Raineyella antarctica]|uniref:Rho termination factor, N-terminal domain n=1 Tax=Raineyella antarctica TaxID=1577474 RepID=A0A1G6GJ17_9ACTN|nr:Rho termination factor N-terminal domain-containing protein [Raineyella antarctica]SDB82007.1 Rho termination factor, N-terminal domain [Raineyella antarctica]